MQAVGLGWVALVAPHRLPYAQMIPPLIVAGVGISTALPAAQNAVVSSVAPREIGKASGTFSTMRQLGGAFGLAIGVAVFTGAGSYASPAAFTDGFAPGDRGVRRAVAGGRGGRAVAASGPCGRGGGDRRGRLRTARRAGGRRNSVMKKWSYAHLFHHGAQPAARGLSVQRCATC